MNVYYNASCYKVFATSYTFNMKINECHHLTAKDEPGCKNYIQMLAIENNKKLAHQFITGIVNAHDLEV
jgi:hypothetical protein